VETHPSVTETPIILLNPKTLRTELSSDFMVLSYTSLQSKLNVALGVNLGFLLQEIVHYSTYVV